MKYDLETLFSEVKDLLVSKLNLKIAEINSEKSDSIVLKTVNDNAYFLQELNGKQTNFNPFILYAVDSSNSQAIASASVEQIAVSIVIVLKDNGQDVAIANRMLRYRRCLKEVIEENYQLINSANILTIQSQVPVAFEDLNSNDSYRVVGVSVQATLS